MRTKISPGSTVNETFFNAWNVPKFFVRPSMVTPTAGLSTAVMGLRWIGGFMAGVT
jgi:hypothetical protein